MRSERNQPPAACASHEAGKVTLEWVALAAVVAILAAVATGAATPIGSRVGEAVASVLCHAAAIVTDGSCPGRGVAGGPDLAGDDPQAIMADRACTVLYQSRDWSFLAGPAVLKGGLGDGYELTEDHDGNIDLTLYESGEAQVGKRSRFNRTLRALGPRAAERIRRLVGDVEAGLEGSIVRVDERDHRFGSSDAAANRQAAQQVIDEDGRGWWDRIVDTFVPFVSSGNAHQAGDERTYWVLEGGASAERRGQAPGSSELGGGIEGAFYTVVEQRPDGTMAEHQVRESEVSGDFTPPGQTAQARGKRLKRATTTMVYRDGEVVGYEESTTIDRVATAGVNVPEGPDGTVAAPMWREVERTLLDVDDPQVRRAFEDFQRADLLLLGLDPDTGEPATPAQLQDAREAVDAWETLVASEGLGVRRRYSGPVYGPDVDAIVAEYKDVRTELRLDDAGFNDPATGLTHDWEACFS